MSKIFLFHKDFPQGKMFDANQAEANFDDMIEDGWADSPAKLDLPKPEQKLASADEVKEANPQELVDMVKALGYMVLTEVEFTAEVSKAAHQLHVDAKLAEDNLAAVAAQEPKLSEAEEKLIAQFNEDAFSLTKPELIQVGKIHGVSLTMNHKEATMVEKINEAMA